ncbi:ribonuclease HII [candidate division KSB1 bacterium]|nr:ribonuclease HII [candidate division KSB1 bacterium]RQW07923.1 MAG: ribonuclease HII [candidate division KSB1 bacterium]
MHDFATLDFEKALWRQGFAAVAGVDEAGRGPLAGPVVAAAVIFPVGQVETFGIHDSKLVRENKRDELFDIIHAAAQATGVGVVDHDDIDRLNILQATYKAMVLAIKECRTAPDYILVDGRGLPNLPAPAQAIVKGDRTSVSIAAASILAKVTRDRLMLEMHDSYPEYGFARHKGYATAGHLQAIRRFGLSPIHRRSFRPRGLLDVYVG